MQSEAIMSYVFKESKENWKMTSSGKFQLSVFYGGKMFIVKSIDRDRCREIMDQRIRQAIELNLVEKEDN